MKKTSCILCLLLPLALCFASPRQELAELSDFRLWGEKVLYERAEFTEEAVWHKTFNHEGGLNLRVIKRGERDEKAGGTWQYVLLTSPVYVESGELLKSYTKFWIFIRDDEEIFDYEP